MLSNLIEIGSISFEKKLQTNFHYSHPFPVYGGVKNNVKLSPETEMDGVFR